MKKSKKFVLAGLTLLAINMVLLPLSGCKTEVDASSPQQEWTGVDNNGSTDSKPCSHQSRADDGDCTTEVKCTVCGVGVGVINGTLGDKTEATEDDINALVEQLKTYVDNGITTIIVTGSEPALIEMYSWPNTAIGEAIYRLSGSDDYDENNPYNGKIDLILPDVTEIVDQEFYSAWELNSINLPKVTKIGDEAFYGCYYLQTITFGSVVTAINHNTKAEFHWVGKKVEGCDLVLNREQVNAEADYQPNIETRTWWNTEWKSITLK